MNTNVAAIEIAENVEPEPIILPNNIRAIRSRVNGAPTITRFTVVRRYRDRWEIHLPDTDATITVSRNQGETAVQALRRHLTT